MNRLLAPIPRPPHDPTSWRLGGRLRWRAASKLIVENDAGELSLAVDPTAGPQLGSTDGSFGGVTTPANVARTRDGDIYLLDRRGPTLRRFDPCCCRFDPIHCIFGTSRSMQPLKSPGGIAICGENLFVCDTGNRRVSVILLGAFRVRRFLVPTSPGMRASWQPTGIAFDGRGRAFVADPANGGVHRFSPGGRWEQFFGGLGAVKHIAVDCVDRIYLAAEGMNAAIVCDGDGRRLADASSPSAIARNFPKLPLVVDSKLRLNFGPCGLFDGNGEPVLETDAAAAATGPKFVTAGTYYSAPLDSELYRCQWHRIVLRGNVPTGTRVVVSTYTAEAILTPDQLLEVSWDTRQTARSFDEQSQWDCLVRSGGGRYLWLRVEMFGNGGSTPVLTDAEIEFPRVGLRQYLPAVFGAEPSSADFTDRFLSLFETTLRGVEREIDTNARYYDPRATPMRSERYSDGDFFAWLASWIGISIDRAWPEGRRREFLRAAGRLFDLRGTREGLRQQLLVILGMQPPPPCPCPARARATSRCCPRPLNCAEPPAPDPWRPPELILEHYRIRRWLFVGAGRLGDEAVLWGRSIVGRSQLGENARAGGTKLLTTPDPLRDPFHFYAHQFTVFLPACAGRTAGARKAIERLVVSESPAHTAGSVRYVRSRFRIGVQSSIGLDAVVARLPSTGVHLDRDKIDRANLLPAARQHPRGPSIVVGREGRIGTAAELH